MGQTALVIGSGMGGLTAAQALSSHFSSSVVLLEKDQPDTLTFSTSLEAAQMGAKARPGVMQYNQAHGLTAKGLAVLDDIFDGRFSKSLEASGAHIIDYHASVIHHHPASGMQPWLRSARGQPSGQAGQAPRVKFVLCTRHMFETTARQLVADNPKVKMITGAAVAGLATDAGALGGSEGRDAATDGGPTGAAGGGPKAVSGVRLSDGSCLSAQLVVDCSGRGSNLPAWLAAAGYKRPRATTAGCDFGYASWLCKLAPEVEQTLEDNNVKLVVTFAAPPTDAMQRAGTLFIMLRVDSGMYMVACGGAEGAHPGRHEDNIRKFAQEKVWHPSAARLLAGSTFLAPAGLTTNINSVWRHYEEVDLPDGLLVLGDAICSFNSTYGQGMTVAAKEAALLGSLLSERAAAAGLSSSVSSHTSTVVSVATAAVTGTTNSTGTGTSSTSWLSGITQQFQQAVLPDVKAAWGLAVGTDMLFAQASSNEPHSMGFADKLGMAYVTQLFKLAPADPVISAGLVRVLGMLVPVEALMQPNILMRFLAHKTLKHTPGPLHPLLAAFLRPWGIVSPKEVAHAAAAAAQPGSKEAALAQLMAWLAVGV